jgi:amidophosphoribosyltransferase
MIEGLSQSAYVEVPDTPEKPMDECGVIGIWAPGKELMQMSYHALLELQHRGQSGAGVLIYREEVGFVGHKGMGLVEQAIPEALPKWEADKSTWDIYEGKEVPSSVALGHVRYSTSGDVDANHPIQGHISKIALAMNGHVEALATAKELLGVDIVNQKSDTDGLTQVIDGLTQEFGNINDALGFALPELDGGYCLVVSDGKQLVGVRDPWGFHPLSLGELPDGGFMLASEPGAFDAVDATFMRDIEPGEIVAINNDGITSTRIERTEPRSTCGFEFIYTARPDSVIDDVSVYRARKNMGRYLARDKPVDADVVVGVPLSGLAAAAGYAQESGLPMVEGLFKNAYVPRTFLERGGNGGKRDGFLRRKLRPNKDEIEGQRLVVVDDSVIKGNTMKGLVKLLRDAGATEVHVRSAAARYMFPCYMGMDTGTVADLIARGRTEDEIAKYLGADSVAYNDVDRIGQSIEEAVQTRTKTSLKAAEICISCTTGRYPFPALEIIRPVMIGLSTIHQRPVGASGTLVD